jgi:nuclear pore complex protein Nup155
VLQAKSAGITADSSRNPIDSSTLDLLEGKLAVLRFQMQIKQELELMAARVENIPSESPSDPFPRDNILADAEAAKAAKDKAKELSLNLKSITQLYNDYAVPFNLWEVWFYLFHESSQPCFCEFNPVYYY